MNAVTMSRVPDYLRCYIVDQDHSLYTPRDHASWRFIMRQARDYLKTHAHEVYLDGLEATGIPVSSIPNITQMDRILNRFGWGAVCVRGFIPPLAFLDFQARQILPIAADMRTLEHVLYTPAPDIVHEAAGHGPILADPGYAKYLTAYAQVARKAIYSSQDIRIYEAIRTLSDLKENPDTTPEEMEQAQKDLDQLTSQVPWVSEATLVARLFWWTAEYGLVGDLEQPKIYGAGLLSSLKESRECLKKAKKIPLSLDCTKATYDITKPQPQLFVARDFSHLMEVLAQLDSTLAYKQGGLYGLTAGLKSQAVTTTELDSGLQVSGIIQEFSPGVDFIKWTGPVQLAFQGQELPGHSRRRHGSGFSLVLGHPHGLTFEVGAQLHLTYHHGFTLSGQLTHILSHPVTGKPLILTLENTLLKKGNQTYYDPSWGPFDLVLAQEVGAVFGGPADWQAYGDYDLGKASTLPGRQTPYSAFEKGLFDFYSQIRAIREEGAPALTGEALQNLAQKIQAFCPEEWLLRVEVAELWAQKMGGPRPRWLQDFLTPIPLKDSELQLYVREALESAHRKD
jgi:phenylalanine-4-hydroxylase